MGRAERRAPRTGGRIQVLPPPLANAIAAGEVVDRPASVVKELVENAIDAGSRRVEVDIRGGGQEYVRVRDDGAGIAPDQMTIAFRRHATSKVSQMRHLEAVRTLGFRGEALPSIAAVARVELKSRARGAPEALRLRSEGGTLSTPEPVGAPFGTSVSVRDLFFNTPARLKFLKTTATERRYVIETVGRLALSHPEIAFRLVAEGREVLVTAGKGDLMAAALAVWGKGLAGSLVRVGDVRRDGTEPAFADAPMDARGAPVVSGLVGKPSVAKSRRTSQAFIINGRWIESVPLRAAVEKAFEGLLPSRHFPVAVLHVGIDPAAVDVNVHPNKTEVRFRDQHATFRAVYYAVREGLLAADLVPRWGERAERSESVGGESAAALEPAPESVREKSDGERYAAGGGEAGVGGAGDTGYREIFPALWDWPERAPGRGDERRLRPGPQSASASEPSGAEAVDPAKLSELEVLGQLDNTYIVARGPDGVTILDQHVVHERVLYESGVARLQNAPPGAEPGASGAPSTAEQFGHQLSFGRAQPLLVPIHLELAPEVIASLSDHLSLLDRLGLTCEPFGVDGLLVRAVPLPVRGEHVRHRMLRKMVEEIVHVLERTEPESTGLSPTGIAELPPYLDRILQSMACRSAVMAGDRLEVREMQALVSALAKADNPFRCPHGRPVLIRMPLEDLERRFGRR